MIDCLVGGQFGSEGKGVVAYALANEYDHHVRVGGPNAGHSIVHEGKLFKMQSIPCGWVNPDADIWIGPGAVLSVEQMMKEIAEINETFPSHSVWDRLHVHPKAGILELRHAEEEGHTGGEIHQRIGSTGEGIGAARRDRMARVAGRFTQAKDDPRLARFLDPDMPGACERVLLEGTQGFGLSLVHGEWPYVTSADTTASTLLADCGYGPRDCGQVILVARSYPIRVAGNSGPMHREVSWADMSERVGRPVEERTTVTKKVRRIGEWDHDLYMRAVRANGATSTVLTFADYLDPSSRGAVTWGGLGKKVQDFVLELEAASSEPVTMIGTGFSEEKGWTYVDRR